MDLDFNKILRITIQTGKVSIGSRQTVKAVDNYQAKAVVLASNCPADVRDRVTGKVPVMDFPGIGVELGTVCSKPFAVAAMAIEDPGESKILTVIKG
ncbi:MAG: 50S ribosomal protein L30e [Methanosarcinales archaeon]|nr:50S ribosomal protein L30e [Methanosarcinales archaeon]